MPFRLLWVLLSAIGYSSLAGASAGPSTSESAPNIVLILSDDQAWTDYGFMGHPHVRTPIMFSWPARLAPADRAEVVSSIDIVPTMLAAAGAGTPAGLPGLDLLPHLEAGTRIPREIIFGENFAHNVADIKDPEASLTFRWCIAGKWKLLLTYDGEVVRTQKEWDSRTVKEPQLFDLLADPHEKQNVATSHPDVVARLAKRIADWYPVRRRKTQDAVVPGEE